MGRSDTVRYGIIGAGLMGQEHIRNVAALDGGVVSAVADPHPRSLEEARALMSGDDLRCFGDHRALLDAGCCDAVVVATPNMTHAAVLRDVLEHPVHILVEKPLCTTVEDCRGVVEQARSHSGVVWMGLEYRYMPPIARLIAETQAGSVGRVRMVAVREHRYPFLDKVGNWNRFNANTGGTLVEKCCHFFDLMNLCTGSRAVSVMASGAQDVNHLDEKVDGRSPDIIDNAFVIVDYANGARASLDLCMFAEGSVNQEEVGVVGDEGKLEAFLPSGVFRRGRREGGPSGVEETVVHEERVRYEGFHYGSSYLEHVDFLEAIRRGGSPAVTLEDGLVSVAIGVAAQRSLSERRACSLREVLGS